MSVKFAVCVNEPDVPVTVTVYVPAGVRRVEGGFDPLLPHPMAWKTSSRMETAWVATNAKR